VGGRWRTSRALVDHTALFKVFPKKDLRGTLGDTKDLNGVGTLAVLTILNSA
jgi:hypothetical protein